VAKSSIRRIGVLTGGGDAPGLNAVIRAVVKSARNLYGWDVLGVEDGFDGLINPEKAYPLTADNVRGILPRGGTILGTNNRGNPFKYRGNPDEPLDDASRRVIENIKKLGIDALAVIGGDGTLAIAHEFSQLGVPIVGIPKTIDNDLVGTDVTFGFDTAMVTATEAIDKLHTTAESHHRVMILEVMGRTAGWIAIGSGIAGGADIILIPEIPYKLDCVVESIAERDEAGSKFSIIVIAEGAAPRGGLQAHVAGTQGTGIRFAGAGNYLGEQLSHMTDHEVRVTVLGHVQRGGSPSPFDRVLATRFGAEAVRLLEAGGFGRMVAAKGDEIDSVPIADVVGLVKRVTPDGEHAETARALGISLCG
jgi:ATP-dependent phosphofructokinase / diphosphate-dependent phosphofructokinase